MTTRPDVRNLRHLLVNQLGAVVMVVLGAITALGYAIITRQVWEDFLITYRHSQNLAEGHGLVFTRGEKVHGFTSVINTLLPALFHWLWGQPGSLDYHVELWAYRLVCLAAFLSGGCFAIALMRHHRYPLAAQVTFACCLAFEPKIIAFTMNGQEAGFLVLFISMSLYALLTDIHRRWRLLGIAWAGLLYTRPDSPIYMLTMAAAFMFFSDIPRLRHMRPLLKAAVLCASLYLPWFLFAWSYYGSPIPHTVLAKSALNQTPIDFVSLVYSLGGFLMPTAASAAQPAYMFPSSWPYWVRVFSLLLGSVSLIVWMFRRADRCVRTASLFFLLLALYLAFIMSRAIVYPWYLPPLSLAMLIVLSQVIWSVPAISLFDRVLFNRNIIPITLCIVIVSAHVWLYVQVVKQTQIHQREIELNHRVNIGLFLREQVKPGQTVYLECLGYIGFYSGAHMLDYPGLASPGVVAALRQDLNLAPMMKPIQVLAPDWLVLRPREMKQLRDQPKLFANYEIVKDFSAKDRLEQYRGIYGFGELEYDTHFTILKKKIVKTWHPPELWP